MNSRTGERRTGRDDGLWEIGVNSQLFAVIGGGRHIKVTCDIQIDREPNQMAAAWFGVRNQALELLVHLFGNTGFQYANIQAKGAWDILCLPPFGDAN